MQSTFINKRKGSRKAVMGGRIIGILLSIALAVASCDTQAAAAFSAEKKTAAGGGFCQEIRYRDFEPEFTSAEIPDEIFERMAGKSYGEDCTMPREQLRYLRMSYVGFDGLPHTGEMIANEAIAEKLLAIFEALYEEGYPIERMELVDEYDGDDEASMEANNTTCFNFRKIAGSEKLSKHSQGLAVDINPLYNPYVKKKQDGLLVQPASAMDYADRQGTFLHKIEEGDSCLRLFQEYGFSWGGNWKSVKDYQHFEWDE